MILWNRHLSDLVVNMQAKIELITMWLHQSGLKVNDTETKNMPISPQIPPSRNAHIKQHSNQNQKTDAHACNHL